MTWEVPPFDPEPVEWPDTDEPTDPSWDPDTGDETVDVPTVSS